MEKGRDQGSPTPIQAMVNMSGICPFSTRYSTFLSSSCEAIPLTSDSDMISSHQKALVVAILLSYRYLYLDFTELTWTCTLCVSNSWHQTYSDFPNGINYLTNNNKNKSLIVLLHPSEKLKINFDLLLLTQKVHQHVIIKILSTRVSTAGDSCLSPLTQYPIYDFFLSSDTQCRMPTTTG